MNQHQGRGIALGTVLACLAAFLVILFTAVSVGLQHLRFVSAYNAQEHAKNLAEAALAQAVHDLAEAEFATTSGQTVVTVEGLTDAEGIVSFDRTGDFSDRFSTNNISNDTQALGAEGVPVPGRTVHLVARGRVGATVRWMECLVYRPPFPDALIATGPVRAEALQLLALRRDGAYTGGDPAGIAPEEVVPGNLFSLSPEGFSAGQPAVVVSAQSDINGSVGAVGGIEIGSDCLVGGEVLPFSESRPMPSIDIVDRIEAILPNAVGLPSTSGSLTLDENWFNSAPGLTVSGDIDLNGSALVVQGDLDVSGALLGTGIVLVDGDVRIGGGSSVVSGEQVAIASTGDMTLQTDNPDVDQNYFKGLMYCEGDFLARNITVVGATVVNGKNGSSGAAQIQNVRFLHNPGSVELSLFLPDGFKFRRQGGMVGAGERWMALSFVLRSDGENRFTAQVSAFYSDDSHSTPENQPSNWSPVEDERLNSTITLVPPMTDDEAKAALQPLVDDFFAWLSTIEGDSYSDSEKTRVLNDLVDRIQDGFNRVQDEEHLSFELNNLFGEYLSGCRILLWRKFEPD